MITAKNILISLIKEFEGCRLKAYKCPANVWTIGYGQTGPHIKKGVEWTQEQADRRLEIVAVFTLESALNTSPVLQDKPYKLAAIADFIYNCGLGNYKKSTLKKRIDEGQWEQAVIEINRWNKGGGKVLPGLVRRRAREAELLLK
jgi:lysozyme